MNPLPSLLIAGSLAIATLLALAPTAQARPLLAPVQAPAVDPPIPPAPPVLTSGELADAIDLALHWVRAQQRPDGGYGTLATTADVLLVLATSPRKYRAVDGPYFRRAEERLLRAWNGQRFEGIASEANELELLNRRMAELLALLDPAQHAAMIKAARAAAGTAPAARPPSDPRASARTLLATRAAAGVWPANAPDLTETLAALHHLIRTHAAVKQSETKSAPREATALPPLAAGTRAELAKSVERGVAFLLAAQDDEGRWGFGGQPDPGITAMVIGAVQALPASARDAETNARISKALDWLRSLQDEAGAIHAGQLKNYVTSASVMALAKRNAPEDQAAIARARAFLAELQSDEGEGYSSEDLYYGGVGYGGDERPDLSNMQMALEALSTAGAQPGDDTFQKALAFLQRCQNNSETNDLALVRDGATIVAGNDGGAGYAPGESKAGFVELADGTQVPRSYGSMTYALLKCYLFAGLPRDDARVEAAWKWITKHYTLDVNPGFEASSDATAAYQGLFYYFYTMAKALALYGEPTIVDPAGRAHDWRTELGGRLVAMQRPDGSWVNTNAERWYEGNPILATAYALTTLDTVLAPARAVGK